MVYHRPDHFKASQQRLWLTRHLFYLAIAITALSCGPLKRPSYSGPPPLDGPGPYVPQGGLVEPEIRSPLRLSSPQLTWPVDQVRITQEFAPIKNQRHQGIDFGGRLGMPIRAAHEGVVIYAGQDFSGYGKMVMIEFSPSWATLYAHLHRIHIKEGAIVRQGDVIGTMGRTGRATGVHLHFELIKDKMPIDPLPYLESTNSRLTRN